MKRIIKIIGITLLSSIVCIIVFGGFILGLKFIGSDFISWRDIFVTAYIAGFFGLIGGALIGLVSTQILK
jgi:hypothetical protein